MPTGKTMEWTARQDRVLRELHRGGMRQRDMAARFGVSHGAIQRRLRHLGLVAPLPPRSSRKRAVEDRREAFVEALAEVGDLEQAAERAGVSIGFAEFTFAEIRIELGDQAI